MPLTFSEHLSLNLLTKTASQTVAKVLKANADNGEPGRWKKQPVSEHLVHALAHIQNVTLTVDREEIENALTRLTMALAMWEE